MGQFTIAEKTINSVNKDSYVCVATDFTGNVILELSFNGAITITMPAPVNINQNCILTIKLTNQSASLTIMASGGGDKIDGVVNGGQTLAVAGTNKISGHIGIYTNGTDWFTI